MPKILLACEATSLMKKNKKKVIAADDFVKMRNFVIPLGVRYAKA